jgi:bifunctional non-homologous end joining protein LigD
LITQRIAGAVKAPLRNVAFSPELCRTQPTPPRGEDWLHEVKWDGYRILATVVGSEVRLWSRNGKEWTAKIPRIASAVTAMKLDSAQLDGELIAMTSGRDDFNALHRDIGSADLAYVLFDIPYYDGQSLRHVPLVERKALLLALLKKRPQPKLVFSEHVIGHGDQVFANAIAEHLEGIVSKRVNSEYRGDRTGAWVKVKARASDEFVVVGFTDPKGSRSGVGALLLAEHDADGKLVYIGRVGTGFDDRTLKELRPKLDKLRAATPTADDGLMAKKDRMLALWVKPRLVIEVFHQGRGGNGLLRQSAFKTFRDDKTVATLAAERKAKRAGKT